MKPRSGLLRQGSQRRNYNSPRGFRCYAIHSDLRSELLYEIYIPREHLQMPNIDLT